MKVGISVDVACKVEIKLLFFKLKAADRYCLAYNYHGTQSWKQPPQ